MTVSQPIAGSEIAAVVIAAVQAYLEDEAALQVARQPTTTGAWKSASDTTLDGHKAGPGQGAASASRAAPWNLN